ncbi:uncharacterized protein LOC117507473 isoform X2 [Thalassophryne amazonica]|uniref:uncharacterized protein LOC117507473 isoform X2 n=1 Tax=Thalassophryne amazonica TaxID=390379 RepID=UPI0014726233|nr:uncharacterized protein LOC117507473 isoform X2 [Thalassophryne amazonica]
MAAPTLQSFNVFLTERLTAVAVDVYGFMEKTVLGYQEEVYRIRQENQRLQRLLDLAYKPEIRINGAVSDAREIGFPTFAEGVSTQVEQKLSISRVNNEEPGILPLRKECGESLTGCVEPPVCNEYSDVENQSMAVTVEVPTEDVSRSDIRQIDFSTSKQEASPQMQQKEYIPRFVKEELGTLAFTEEHVTDSRRMNFSILTQEDPTKVQQKEYISSLRHGEPGILPWKAERSDTRAACEVQNVTNSQTQIVTTGEETENQFPTVTDARWMNFSTLTQEDPTQVQQKKKYISRLGNGEPGILPWKEECNDTWTGCVEQNVTNSQTQVVTAGEETEAQLPSGMAPFSAAERQRQCRARCNADPERREKHLQRESERWRQTKTKRKRIHELNERDQRHRRKLWREQQQRARLKRKATVSQLRQGLQPGPSRSERTIISVPLHITAWQ